MRSEHQHEDSRLLIEWLKNDANLAGDNLEDRIMINILPQAVPARKRVTIPNGLIMAGYCILTLTALILCLLSTDLVVFVQFLGSGRPDDEYNQYINLITAIIALAALCFIGYSWKLKKAVNMFC